MIEVIETILGRPQHFPMLMLFNLIENGSAVLDPEGVDVDDLEHAMCLATAAGREIMAAQILLGHLDFTSRIEVTDEDGNTALCVRFGELVTIGAG